MRKITLLALTSSLLAAAVSAHADSPIRLVEPAFGVVDFGDRVGFRLEGEHCAGTRVGVRITAGPAGRSITGVSARAVPDVRTGAGCVGAATVPSDPQVRALGWRPGDFVSVNLASAVGWIPLRFQRFEVDRARVVAGNPAVVPAHDEDSGPRERAVSIQTGDAFDLGRVSLEGIDSIGIRVCSVVRAGFPVTPTLLSLRAGSPTGEAYAGPYDIGGPTSFTRGESGFRSCFRLSTVPLIDKRRERAPRLFLAADAVAPGTALVSSVDFNGTGARLPASATPDPARTRVLFNGKSFAGWTAPDCKIRDGAITGDETATANTRGVEQGAPTDSYGCTARWDTKLQNVFIRLKVRRASFADNGGIYLGGHEIQLRSAGEWLPGGYVGEYAANWQKLNAWPAWTEIEIVQLGSRHVVRVNGRTVTDHIAANGAPAPYFLTLYTQPVWSARPGVQLSLGNEVPPQITGPSDWGNFWFASIRAYRCTTARDPVCLARANALPGQAPRW